MTWVRFDDCAIDHPKFLGISAEAFRLWFEGMAFCNKHLTDGLISRVALKGFRYVTRKRVEELVERGLWDGHDIGFKVHDYLDWNDSREIVLKKREASKARTRKARHGVRSPLLTPNAGCGVDLPTSVLSEEREQGDEPDAFSRFWAVYPKKQGKLAALKLWLGMMPAPAFAERIVIAAERYAEHVRDHEPRFIKGPGNWLEGGHWDDQYAATPVARSSVWTCPHEPTCHKSAWECKRDWDLEQDRKARTA